MPWPYDLDPIDDEVVGSFGAHYMPILKSRQGELNALAHLDEPFLDEMFDLRPLLEVVEVDLDGASSDDRNQALGKVAAKVVKAWPPGRKPLVIDAAAIEVDTTPAFAGHMDEVTQDPVAPDLLARLAQLDVNAMPAIHLSDPEAVIDGLKSWFGHGACLRVQAEDLDDTVVPLEDAIQDLLDECELEAREVDLLMDFGAIVDDDALAMASRLAKFVLPSLDRFSWRSLAVGAGAFPADLSQVAAYQIGTIRRLDRELWHRLKGFTDRRLDFADYAVTHPRLQTGVAFAAPPQMRYATVDAWAVAKGRRTDPRGHRQFFDICQALRTSVDDVLERTESWGDEQFHVAADKAGTDQEGMGNASTWRAIATSHHIAQVRHQLRLRGEP